MSENIKNIRSKIIIVDDDPIMGTLLEVRLADFGFEAEYLSTACEALDKLKKITQSNPLILQDIIIISDILMPDMNGYEFHNLVRQKKQTSAIPFIFLSAKSDFSEQIYGLELGADDYICKPFEIEDLIKSMKKLVNKAFKAKEFDKQANFDGNLAQIKLSEVMQIIEMNHKTGEVYIKTPDFKLIGKIFFMKGKIINALTQDFEAEEAFFELLEVKEGVFEFKNKNLDYHTEKIKIGNSAILANGSRILENSKNLSLHVQDLDSQLIIKSKKILSQIEEKLEAQKIFSLIEAKHTAKQVIQAKIMSQVHIRSVLVDLFKLKFIDLKSKDDDELISAKMIEESLLKAIKEIRRRCLNGILEIKGIKEKAIIYFQDGIIIHAYHGRVAAKKALFRIFNEKKGYLKFHQQPFAVSVTINEPLRSLIEQADSEIKELSEIENKENNLDDKDRLINKILVANPKKIEFCQEIQDRSDLKSIISFVQQYDGKVLDIFDASRMTDLKVYKCIFKLLELKAVEFLEIQEIQEIQEGKEDKENNQANQINQNETVELKDFFIKNQDIQVITDSSCDLPPELIEVKEIGLIPMSINLEQKIYYDGINLIPENFYEIIKNNNSSSIIISAPSENEINSVFEDVILQKDILAIFPSKKISKTFENALNNLKKNKEFYLKQRQENLKENSEAIIEIINSKTVSMGLGLLVLEACDKIKQNLSLNQILDYINKLAQKIKVFILTNSSKIIEIKNEEIIWHQVSQTSQNLEDLQSLIEKIFQNLENSKNKIKMSIMHANSLERANKLKSIIERNFNCEEIIISHIGPMIGLQAGYKSVGVAFYEYL